MLYRPAMHAQVRFRYYFLIKQFINEIFKKIAKTKQNIQTQIIISTRDFLEK